MTEIQWMNRANDLNKQMKAAEDREKLCRDIIELAEEAKKWQPALKIEIEKLKTLIEANQALHPSNTPSQGHTLPDAT